MKKYFKRILPMVLVLVLFMPGKFYGAGPRRRVLILNNSEYLNGTLYGVRGDRDKLINMFENNYFENKKFDELILRENQTREGIFTSLEESFKDNTDEDISYIYYSGHGAYSTKRNMSTIVGVDHKPVYVDEFELTLRKLKGTFVIIFDSCNSGGFIERGTSPGSRTSAKDFNQGVLEVFSRLKPRKSLRDRKYYVLTAASENESSYEINFGGDWGWGGIFTKFFLEGNGYKGQFQADLDGNGLVSLGEMESHLKGAGIPSEVNAYPENSSFIIGGSYLDLGPMREDLVSYQKKLEDLRDLAYGDQDLIDESLGRLEEILSRTYFSKDEYRRLVEDLDGLITSLNNPNKLMDKLTKEMEEIKNNIFPLLRLKESANRYNILSYNYKNLDTSRPDLIQKFYGEIREFLDFVKNNEGVNGDFKLWQERFQNLAKDTIWRIEFNQELDLDSFGSRVYILDGENNKNTSVLLSLTQDKKGINIVNTRGYEPGKSYRLFIEKGVRSKSSFLKNHLVIEFTVVS